MARPQLLANAVVFLCGNLTGAFHKHQMQDASRDLFTYTVKCIQIRRKLRIEKRQQVGTRLPLEPQPDPARPPGCPPGPTPCILSLRMCSLNNTARHLGHLARHLCWRHPGGCWGHGRGCACRVGSRV